ncbi:MAG TPA: hypothetical protein VI386_04350 [Candidatus Sulfotelmatobacter sp.]
MRRNESGVEEGKRWTKIESAKMVTIRECGYDEYWLRDKIFEDPAILGLGDLQAVLKEKSQSQGGRLDLLLKNPEDDSMFEVELQLGATDESHIIRTIEYWDNEKRRWPKRSHTAVLVAEKITSRFFNVVHLLSLGVPIIGIQANIVQAGSSRGLHFTKVIDSYEEPEDEEGTPQELYDEKHWLDSYPRALDCARWYRALLERLYGEVPIKYFESYISLLVGGTARVWINTRKNDRAFIEVKYGEKNFQEAVDQLNKDGVSFNTRKGKYLTFNVNLQQLKERASAHEWVAARLSPSDLKKTD